MRRPALLLLALAACSGPAPDDGGAGRLPTAPTASTPDATSTGMTSTEVVSTGVSPPSSTPSASASAAGAPTTPAPAATTRPADVVRPEGFDRVAARVVGPDGAVCDLCVWLADDADRRRRGLMFVSDLGPADGMAFRYDAPHTGTFWMKNTVLPLSIAFFDPAGAYVEAFDMEPCPGDPCPRYPTPRGFSIAVETRRGGLVDLGMVPGSSLELLDLPCPPG